MIYVLLTVTHKEKNRGKAEVGEKDNMEKSRIGTLPLLNSVKVHDILKHSSMPHASKLAFSRGGVTLKNSPKAMHTHTQMERIFKEMIASIDRTLLQSC